VSCEFRRGNVYGAINEVAVKMLFHQ